MNPGISSLDWDHEDITMEAILYEQSDVSSQQVPMQVCQAQLKRSADRLSVGAHGDRLVYGNCHGLGLLEEVIELRRDLTALMSKVETLTMKDLKREEVNKESAQEVQALKGKVTQLSRSSKGYLKSRRRFIAVYERDFKGRKDPKGSDAIQGGNFKARGGDAVADAMVFDEDGSLDKTVYEELYGLQHTKVIEWNESGVEDGGLFRDLNAYATSVAQGKMSEEVTRAFGYFITRVKENWLQPPNQEPNTLLYSAYYAFWNKHRELVEKWAMPVEK